MLSCRTSRHVTPSFTFVVSGFVNFHRFAFAYPCNFVSFISSELFNGLMLQNLSNDIAFVTLEVPFYTVELEVTHSRPLIP
jgi:hypothetical protein